MTLPNLDNISTREKEVLAQLKDSFPSAELYVYERCKHIAKVEVYFDNDGKDFSEEKRFYDAIESERFVQVPAMGQSLGIIHILLS